MQVPIAGCCPMPRQLPPAGGPELPPGPPPLVLSPPALQVPSFAPQLVPAVQPQLAPTVSPATQALPGGVAPVNDAGVGAAIVQPTISTTVVPQYVPQYVPVTAIVGGEGGGPAAAPAQPAIAAAATPDDQQLLSNVFATMRTSATAGALAARLLASNTQLRVLDDATFDAQVSPSMSAMYDAATNTILLKRGQLAGDVQRAAITLAHESVHALDDAQIDTAQALAVQQAGSMLNGAAWLAQRDFEIHMVAETRAYMLQAQVTAELGLDSRRIFRVQPAVALDGSLRSYEQTWTAVQAMTEYNPHGRRAAPRGY